MPLPLKDRKVAAVEYVIKKIKGSDSYDKMKEYNESGEGVEKLMMRKKPEADYQIGMDQAVSEMMSAVKSNDSEAFKNGLKGFVSMMIEEYEAEESLAESQEKDD